MKPKTYFEMEWWDINISVSLILNKEPIELLLYEEDGTPHYEGEEREYIIPRSDEICFDDIKQAAINGHIPSKTMKKILYLKKELLIKWFIDNPQQQDCLSEEFLKNWCLHQLPFSSDITKIRKQRQSQPKIQDSALSKTILDEKNKKNQRGPNTKKMFMLILGIAMEKWGYNPDDNNKDSPSKKISDAVLRKTGYIVTDETILDYLRKGWEIKKENDKNKSNKSM